MLPLAAVGVALCLDAILRRRWIASSPIRAIAASGLTVGVLAYAGGSWIAENRRLIATNLDVTRLWSGVERALRDDGVRHAAQVFTDSFDFYFVSVRSARSWDYRPRNTGGWAQIDLYGYQKVYPPIRTSSLDDFLADCRAYGVTHLVLTPTARFVLGPLGAMQSGGALPRGVRDVATLDGGVRIVALVAVELEPPRPVQDE